jgi:FkbM family methyltransferase
MGIGSAIERLALRLPQLAHLALWGAARIEMRYRREPHWLFKRLTTQFDYRAPVVARLGNGMRIQVPWMDVAGRAICEDGWYEPDTVRILSTLLRPGAVFLDVGAAFGQYALLAAGVVGDTGKVHAFEPEPVSFDWLRGNVRRNRLGNVTAAQIALGDAACSLDLYIGSPDNLGTTSLRRQYNYAGRTARVEVMPLDRYLERVGLGRVDVIKIDVEGAESLVFRGAEKVLATRPAMIIEFEESNQVRFGSSCAELARMLVEKGYKLESILEGERIPYEAAHSTAHYTFNVVATRA